MHTTQARVTAVIGTWFLIIARQGLAPRTLSRHTDLGFHTRVAALTGRPIDDWALEALSRLCVALRFKTGVRQGPRAIRVRGARDGGGLAAARVCLSISTHRGEGFDVGVPALVRAVRATSQDKKKTKKTGPHDSNAVCEHARLLSQRNPQNERHCSNRKVPGRQEFTPILRPCPHYMDYRIEVRVPSWVR